MADTVAPASPPAPVLVPLPNLGASEVGFQYPAAGVAPDLFAIITLGATPNPADPATYVLTARVRQVDARGLPAQGGAPELTVRWKAEPGIPNHYQLQALAHVAAEAFVPAVPSAPPEVGP